MADGIPDGGEQDSGCSWEAVFSDVSVPCMLPAGHGGTHLYTPPLDLEGP